MSEMVSLRTEGNGVKRIGTASAESASSSGLGILDPTSADLIMPRIKIKAKESVR